MYRLLITALVLLAASCGGNTDTTTTPPTSSEATSTSAASDASTTTAVTESTTSSTAEPTTSATTVTTTTLAEGDPAIRIDEVVFAGEPYLIIANRGTGGGSTAGHWICQFPSYYELPAVNLQPGERLAIPLGEGEVPQLAGVVASVDVTTPLGSVTGHDGEIGLYRSNVFNSADAIVDYVEWGFPGHARSEVAIAAQIWTQNGYVEVPAEMLAIVAQTFPTVGPQDWFAEIGG
ncbi:MAG: hypothetical protein GY720_04515 [bacterium]|nr:hypothetical protein [bacterium]